MRIPDYSYCIFHVLKDGMVLVQGHHPERAYIRAAYADRFHYMERIAALTLAR